MGDEAGYNLNRQGDMSSREVFRDCKNDSRFFLSHCIAREDRRLLLHRANPCRVRTPRSATFLGGRRRRQDYGKESEGSFSVY